MRGIANYTCVVLLTIVTCLFSGPLCERYEKMQSKESELRLCDEKFPGFWGTVPRESCHVYVNGKYALNVQGIDLAGARIACDGEKLTEKTARDVIKIVDDATKIIVHGVDITIKLAKNGEKLLVTVPQFITGIIQLTPVVTALAADLRDVVPRLITLAQSIREKKLGEKELYQLLDLLDKTLLVTKNCSEILMRVMVACEPILSFVGAQAELLDDGETGRNIREMKKVVSLVNDVSSLVIVLQPELSVMTHELKDVVKLLGETIASFNAAFTKK